MVGKRSPCVWVVTAAALAVLLPSLAAGADDPFRELAAANSDLAKQLKTVPEIADGVDEAEAKALGEIARLCRDESEYRDQLLRLLLDCQRGGLNHFKYPLPEYNCAPRVLLWLALADKLEGSENLCLATAITDGVFLIIGDDAVKETVKTDAVDMVTFFIETEEIQKRLGHKPLREYPPGALLMLAWRGGSLSSHSFDQRLQPGYFIRDIRERPLTATEYRMHTVTAANLRAMQKALLEVQPTGNQRRMASTGYNFYSTKNWDFVEDDKPQRVRIGGNTVSTPWTRSAALIFQRRMKSGKGIGNCSDQDDARQAIWKCIGVPSMNVKMIQIRKEAEGKFWGHIISLFYDADRAAWCGVNTAQRDYPYVWAVSVAPVRYRDYLTPQSGFPKPGSRNYGYEIVSGQGKQGGRNDALTAGIPEAVMETVIVDNKTETLGAALAK